MAKIKHSKYKNVGLLFEILTRKVTSEMLNRQQATAYNILKKHFKNNNDCQLTKAVKLYGSICNETVTENKATSLIDLVESLWKQLDHNKLNEELYRLVKDIKNRYEDKDFFQTRVPHYTKLASTYQVLTFTPSDDPTGYLNLRESLAKQMTQQTAQSSESLKEWATQDKEVRQLALKEALKKFNSRYKQLNENQRNLLAAYISQDVGSTTFRQYVYQQVVEVTQQLSRLVNKVHDKALAIKLEQAVALSESILNSNVIKDNHLTALMKYFELVQVLNNEGK